MLRYDQERDSVPPRASPQNFDLSVQEAVQVQGRCNRRMVGRDARVRSDVGRFCGVLPFALPAPAPAYALLDDLCYDALHLDHPIVTVCHILGEGMALRACLFVDRLLPVYVFGSRVDCGFLAGRPAHHTRRHPVLVGHGLDLVVFGIEILVGPGQPLIVPG